MAQIPRLLVAAAPGTALPSLPVSVTRVHTGCCVGTGGTLLRSCEEGNWRGGLLMVSGGENGAPSDPDRCCRQLITLCRAKSVSGIVGNWPSASEWTPLTARLDRTAEQAGLSFRVPEYFSGAVRHAGIMISSQLSGGTFSRRLREALGRWGRQITLLVECVPWRFPLPCPPGREEPLESEQLKRMLSRQPRVWFSESLCAQYFTCMAADGPWLVLFDNGGSIRRKLELAAQLGIPEALFSWEEIRPFSDELFSSRSR